MSFTLKKYPYDPTGQAPSNRVTGELHTLPEGPSRVVVPHYGPFYSEGVRVFNRLTLQPIDPQFVKPCFIAKSLTEKVPGEVCYVLLITDPDYKEGDEVELEYRCVGGENVNHQPLILDLLKTVLEDDRPVKYSELVGLPDGFPVEDHRHDARDIYGLENLVIRLKGIADAILVKDSAVHEEIWRRFEVEASKVDADILTVRDQILDELAAHAAREDNPHKTTKNQVGLNYAPNFPPATIQATIEGLDGESLVVPAGARAAIEELAKLPLDDHASRTDNPHYTTKDQLELGLVVNYPVATDEQATQGLTNEAYITPYGVKLLVAFHALKPLQDHIDDVGNPHGTRKQDVGLDLAPNYPPTTIELAREGVNNTTLMTPATAWAAIQALFTDPITEHKAREDNPHKTTKAQVGLGDVDNFSKAYYDARYAPTSHNHQYDTLPFDAIDVLRWNQAKSDLENVPFFDPAGTYQYLRAGGTTKADVGLPNAPNWSQAEFDNRYSQKDHDHPEYITPDAANSRYAPKGEFAPLVRYAQDYAKYVGDKFILGQSASEPSEP